MAFSSFLLCLLSILTVVSGANVTTPPRTVPSNPGDQIVTGIGGTTIGYVNVTLSQFYNWYATYANGTIFFDVSGTTAPQQGTYAFQVFGNGNGNMQIRFKGPQPIVVTQNATSSTYSNSAQWQQITYTGLGKEGPLVLVYSGPATARTSFTLAAIILFMFLSLMFPITFMKWLVDASRSAMPFTALLQDKKRFMILLIAVSIIGIVGVITVLLEPLLG